MSSNPPHSNPTPIPTLQRGRPSDSNLSSLPSDGFTPSPLSRYTGQLDQRIEYSPNSHMFYQSIALPDSTQQQSDAEPPSPYKKRGDSLRRSIYSSKSTEEVNLLKKDTTGGTSIQSIPKEEDDMFDDDHHDEDVVEDRARNESFVERTIYWHMLLVAVLALVGIVGVLISSLVMSQMKFTAVATTKNCADTCTYQVVESLPDQINLELLPDTNLTFNSWIDMIDNARDTLKIACFYSNLRNNATEPHNIGGWMGNSIFDAIVRAHKRGVQVTIVQNVPTKDFPDLDTLYLQEQNIARVVNVHWSKVFDGGVLHTKLLIADDENFYVGSANLDWTSLAQVKELGIYVKHCSCLAEDIKKIWSTYEYLGATLKSTLRKDFRGWPQTLQTAFGLNSPLKMAFQQDPEELGKVFISSSPLPLNPPDRTNDIAALINVINTAKKSVVISVMDYLPLDIYSEQKRFWGDIDDALRAAVVRNVTVRMLISKWSHTTPAQIPVLDSLNTMGKLCQYAHVGKGNLTWCTGSLEVRSFIIPDAHGYEPYPFTRVNHAKYMVSETTAYISTSNWSFDYFYKTAGISFVSSHEHLREKVLGIFDRDWNSEYAHPIVE